MKKYAKFLMLVLVCFFAVSCVNSTDTKAQEYSLAPDFSLRNLEGNLFSLSSFRNKQPVVLFFWTTWCPYCRRELKALNEIYPEIKSEGFELLSINIGEPAYKVVNIVERYNLSFKILLDEDSTVAESYYVLGIPTYVIINKKEEIVFMGNRFPKDNYKKLISE